MRVRIKVVLFSLAGIVVLLLVAWLGGWFQPAAIDVWQVEKLPSKRLALLLPADQVRVDVLQFAMSRRAAELAAKMKNSMEKNPGPWLEHTSTTKAGEPLPYDPRYGVTESEYDEFIATSKTAVLQKTGEAVLSVSSDDKHCVTITGLPNLDSIQFDTERLRVTTPYGTVAGLTEVTPKEEQRLTGPLNGYTWKSGALSFLADHTIKVSMMQARDSMDVLMELRIKDNQEQKYIADYLIRYPGPRKSKGVGK